MLTIYRFLLHLYPASYRERFAAEMMAVFIEVRAETANKGVTAGCAFSVREAAGLLRGAVQEHVRSLSAHLMLSFPTRSFSMRNGFRFPKSTPILMTIILAGCVLAIERGKAISASLPQVNPHVGPIQPMHQTFLPVVALAFAFFYLAGMLGWVILYALRRSGMHRLAEMSAQPK